MKEYLENIAPKRIILNESCFETWTSSYCDNNLCLLAETIFRKIPSKSLLFSLFCRPAVQLTCFMVFYILSRTFFERTHSEVLDTFQAYKKYTRLYINSFNLLSITKCCSLFINIRIVVNNIKRFINTNDLHRQPII